VRLAFINTRIQHLGIARNALSHSHWSRTDVLISGGMVQRISWLLRRDTDAPGDQQRRRPPVPEANQGVPARRSTCTIAANSSAGFTARATAGRFDLFQALQNAASDTLRSARGYVADDRVCDVLDAVAARRCRSPLGVKTRLEMPLAP
jgi:hypothetical protein